MSQNSKNRDKRSLMRNVLLELERMQSKLEAMERARTEPIAIIGIGCCFPGGANNPESFWQLLENGVDAIREVPQERWDIEAYYDPDPDAPGKMYVRHGGFLDKVDTFDPQFFGIYPREAMSMDPQQRLLLEVSWEALENAGLPPDRLVDSQTGVYMGLMHNDYLQIQTEQSDSTDFDLHMGTGSGLSCLAGRLSYTLGFQGPSMVVATACSSSLVATHLACQALRAGECDLALAGGANLILSPCMSIVLSKMHAVAPDGRCKTFDATADGYGRGEGCGVVVLKRLSDALAKGDTVLALIRSTAVNHNGPSGGLTVPNGPAQEDLLRKALASAGVEPAAVSYVEAHGTGTSLGDPIEVQALGEVMGKDRPKDCPLLIGSVKTNIGHLEAAAGAAGLIKTVLALQHQRIPPHLHLKEPNPHIPWEEMPLVVATELTSWPAINGRRIAGVSAFGMSGINAYVVLEEAPAQEFAQAEVERPLHILTLSAKTERALQELAGRYEAHLSTHPDIGLGDVCFSANTGRAHFRHRLSVVAETLAEMREELTAFTTGQEAKGVFYGEARSPDQPKIAFLFTGQGSQYIGMGRQLYETQPTFRQVIDRCDEILRPHLEQPLLSVLYPESGTSSLLDGTAYTQPALFALEYALAKLWMSWGIEPAVVMGHSVGEYVAACVAGVFGLEDGLKLIAQRGRLMQALPQDGEMVVVFASEARVAEAMQSYAQEASIAAINGPQSLVISGQRQAVQDIVANLEAEGVKTRKLQVSHAFHSPLMEPMLADFEQAARGVTYTSLQIDLISNVTGELVSTDIATSEYWCRHIRQPVRFAASMETLHQQGVEIFVEIGPKPNLLSMGRHCLPREVGVWLPSLRQGQSDWQQLLYSLGELYARGVKVNWFGFDRDYPRHRLQLPTYPFQRQRYWVETAQRTHPKLVKQRRQQTTPASIKNVLYEVEWYPQVFPNQQLPPDYMPTPTEISNLLLPQLAQLTLQPDIKVYEEALDRLEALSVAYVVRAFQQMDWEFQLDKRFSTAEMTEQLGVVGQHQRLLERLLEMLAEEGSLRRIGSQWEMVEVPEIQDPQGQMSALLAQYPLAEAELTLLGRCGSGLVQALRGECDPLQWLFPNGDLTTATQLYQDSPGAQVMNTLVQKVVLSALEHLPQGRGVRVLEIGAGTGGTTSYILPHLPVYQTEYVFSDISPLFTTQAQERFRHYPFMRYQVLDIEQAPEAQGFDLHRFDLIVAANVLHATSDLRQTLQHVQQLLAPEGMLVLLEGTTPQRWVDLTFGLTEGWWRFADQSLRPSHPLLSATQWQKLLQECGFKQTATISSDRGSNGVLSQQAVIVAQATELGLKLSPQSWLILADAQGVGQQLGELLRAKGEVCVLVFPGKKYEQVTEQEFKVAPTSPEDFERLSKAMRATQPPLRWVVNLWSLDAVGGEDLTKADIEAATQNGCGSTLHLVQSLVKAEFSEPPSLWLVTRGAQPVGTGPVAVTQSPLWGMGRVVALEHPELWGGMIDLDPDAADGEVSMLLSEIWHSEYEDHIAFRDGQRYAARLVRSSYLESQSVRFHSDGAYLITGGLGFLGIKVARWMVEQGARHLILTGRRGLPERDCWTSLSQDTDVWKQVKAVQSLEEMGATVVVFRADVTDPAQMSKVFERVNAAQPPLQGIIHAAGVAEYQALKDIELSTLESVFAPKTVGAWILHQLTKNMDLDVFVCFSSAGSVWGAKGQGHYDAANHFLDALAHYRRSIGLPALSVNWGLLVGGGMVTEEYRQWLTQIGLEELSPEQGFDALGYLLGTNAIQATVAKVDWVRFKELYEIRRRHPLLEQVEPRPSYPFQRQRYWVEDAKTFHPLLGQRLRLPLSQEIRFETQFNPTSPPYLDDHKVYGTLVVAGASHISMVLSAVKEAFGVEPCILEDIFFPQAIVLSDQSIRTVQLVLAPHETTATSFQIVSSQEGEDEYESTSWTLHVAGKVQMPPTDVILTSPEPISVEEVQARCPGLLSGEQFYSNLWEAGYHMGTSFRWIKRIWQGKGEALCQLRLPHLPDEISEYQLYPGLIDASLLLLASCWKSDFTEELTRGEYVYLPFHMASYRFYGRPSDNRQLWCYAQIREQNGGDRQGPTGDTRLFDEAGQIIAEVSGLESRRADRKVLLRGLRENLDDWAYEIGAEGQKGSIREELLAVGPAQRQSLLESHIQEQVAHVLRLAPSQIELYTPLQSLALDSLMALELRNRLGTGLGLALPIEKFLQGPSIARLATQLIEQLTMESLIDSVYEQIIEPPDDGDWEVIEQ